MRKITKSIKETHKLAENLANQILSTSQVVSRAVVVALVGDLGSGKTTFTQGFAKALGVKEQILSPTFVILKKFKIKNLKFKILTHIDAYRIDNPKEILDLNWEEMINNPKNIILIEWAEKVMKILKKPYYLVKFEHRDENTRGIDISVIK